MKRIILTGGGTAGHVTPNIALIPKLKEEGYDIHYIGSYNGIEKKLIEDMRIPYHGISSGKLRRYFDVKNFSDPFRVIKGYGEASRHRIPAIIHESDMTPGLANKLCIPSAAKICCNFPEAMEHLPKGKAVLTGTPIRQELFHGNPLDAIQFTGLRANKPTILVIGGSTGSVRVNEAVRECLDELLKTYQIIHLCGKGKLDIAYEHRDGYVQYEYIKKELSSLLALADIVISRAGANAICELQALAKPNLLIPLGAKASRGDQILNAESFKKQGFSYVLPEEDLTKETLLNAVDQVYTHRADYQAAMKNSRMTNSIDLIVDLINDACQKNLSQ